MAEAANLKDPQTWLEVAEIKLENARQIFNLGLYDDAISRLYYAMFYAAKAALLIEGLDLRKHSSAVTKFRELFVLTGRVEAEYLRYLERSDYAPFIPTSHADAKEMLATAETFIAKMKEVVKNYPRSASLENESP
ncbi:MAG: HEPN domain-containing protein [Anaerolineales bacterium]|nr:HEPN domain-containing protein [Anaerolineales bacterium]